MDKSNSRDSQSVCHKVNKRYKITKVGVWWKCVRVFMCLKVDVLLGRPHAPFRTHSMFVSVMLGVKNSKFAVNSIDAIY